MCRVGYANQVQNIPLDWALGAFILQSTAKLDLQPFDWIPFVLSGNSSALLLIFGILLVLIAAWFLSKWRNPQLKTIYDLEKGKYIVTRVNRYS